jgi:hypothetical protein
MGHVFDDELHLPTITWFWWLHWAGEGTAVPRDLKHHVVSPEVDRHEWTSGTQEAYGEDRNAANLGVEG